MKGMTNRQQGFFIFLVVLAGAVGIGGLPHGRDDWMAYLLLSVAAVPIALMEASLTVPSVGIST